jgi:hypothetical protein
MGAFILFPVLIFSVFITAILGFTDWIHVDTLVHAAAQAAVTAAAENAVAPGTSGIYNGAQNMHQGQGYLRGQGLSGNKSQNSTVPLDEANINLSVGQMLTGKPYITNYTCSTTTSVVTCQVHFNVSMPIVGTVHATTTVSSTNLAS